MILAVMKFKLVSLLVHELKWDFNTNERHRCAKQQICFVTASRSHAFWRKKRNGNNAANADVNGSPSKWKEKSIKLCWPPLL